MLGNPGYVYQYGLVTCMQQLAALVAVRTCHSNIVCSACTQWR